MIRVTICGDVVPVDQIEAICEAVGASIEIYRDDTPNRRLPLVATIIADVAREMGLSPASIVGSRGAPRHYRARCAVSWLAARVSQHSLSAIGRAMGGRDHSTIKNQYLRACELRVSGDPAFERLTDRLADQYREARA